MNSASSESSCRQSLISYIDYLFSRIEKFKDYDSYLSEPYTLLKRTSDRVTLDEYGEPTIVNLDPYSKALLRLFERMIGMFQAGKQREVLFKTIYAFPEIQQKMRWLLKVEDIFELDQDFIPVNLTEEYVDRWLQCLCGLAKSVKKSSEPLHTTNISKFFLIGDVGTGKTTFLNYAFSKHYGWMRDIGIIWIRVDLTKARYQQSLFQSLEDQVAKVFRGSYHDDLWAQHEEEIVQEIKKRFVKDPDWQESFKTAMQEYLQPYNDNRTRPYNMSVQKGIKAWLEDKYSMIYILDGMDRLNSEEDFKAKITEIQKEILGTEKAKHLFIIVMRGKSHVELMKAYIDPIESVQFSALRKEAKTFVVLPPKLEELMNKRIAYIEKNWTAVLQEEQNRIFYPKIKEVNYPKRLEEDLAKLEKEFLWITKERLDAYYQIFLLYIYRALSFKDTEEAIKDWNHRASYTLLKDLAGTNFRVLLRILCLSHRRFIETLQLLNMRPPDLLEVYAYLEKIKEGKELIIGEQPKAKSNLYNILKKHYRVVEILIRHPLTGSRKVEYVYQNKKIVGVPSSGNVTTTYLSNIFRVANVPNVPQERTLLLSKTRILQYLQKNSEATGEEILHYLVDQFGYPRDNIKLDLDDLEKDALVAQAAKYPDDGSIPIITYHNTRTGIKIIEDLIGDFNYLAMISEDIVVPAEIIDSLSNGPDYSPHDNWTMWNISRVPRVINIVCLISSLERLERTRFSEIPADYKPFELTSRIISRVQSVMLRIINSAITQGIEVKQICDIIDRCDMAKSLKNKKKESE